MKIENEKFRIFLNTTIVTVSTIVEKFAFFIINILIARYLTIELFGEYTTALGYATFFAAFVHMNINYSLIRAMSLEQDYENEHLTNSIVLRTLLFLIAYTVMAISLVFTNYNINTIILVLILGMVRFSNEFLNGFYAFYDAKEKFYIPAIFTFVFSALFLSSTALVINLDGTYFDLALVRLGSVIVLVIAIIILIFRNSKFIFVKKIFKNFSYKTIPFALSLLYYNIIMWTNMIILSIMQGTVYAGLYNNAYVFYITLSFIPGNFSRVLVPYLFKISFKDNKEKFQFLYEIFSKFFGIISFYFLIIFYLFSSNIIIIVFGNKYTGSIPILKILSFAIPFIFYIAPIIITALDKQEKFTKILGIGVIVNLIANMILIYLFKAEGAAVAVVITQAVLFILSNLYLRINKYVKLRKIVWIFIILSCISSLCFLGNEYFLQDIHWFYSLIIISILYFILVLMFMIRYNDIRVLGETFNIKFLQRKS